MFKRSTFLSALGAVAVAAPAVAESARTISVGANPNDPYAQPYYTLDGGFISKAGLSLDIATFPNGGPIVTAVAAGTLNVGLSNPQTIAVAVSHGIPFVFFAGSALYTSTAPTSALCVSVNSSIREIKDFSGKTIALSSLKDSLNLGTVEYLLKGGVDPATVKFVEIPFASMAGAVSRGTVDAAMIVEPSLTISLATGSLRVFAHPVDALAPRLLSSGWFTTADWYRKNTSLVKRLTGAIYASARWANTHHDATAKILLKHSKLEAAVARKMTRVAFAESLDPRLIDPYLAASARLKITSRLVRSSEMIAQQ